LELSKRTNLLSAIQIDTTLPSPSLVTNTTVTFDYPLKIKATAEGGGVGWKEIKASIIVCRNETLFLNNTGPLNKRLYTNSSIANETIFLPDLFNSSDPYCEPFSYTLKNVTGNPAFATGPSEE